MGQLFTVRSSEFTGGGSETGPLLAFLNMVIKFLIP
jgi:hypothetical protein